jgi:hypothetical protein
MSCASRLVDFENQEGFWPKNHTDSTPLPGAWPDIHMNPSQGVQSHFDLQQGRPSGVLLPIHWSTFNLSLHPWAEPGEWTPAAAGAVGQAVAVPVPGQPFEPAGDLPTRPWWRDVALPLDDGGEVSFEAVGEGVEAGQVVGADRLDPLRESVALELGEHLPGGADVPGEGIQFGTAGEDGFQLQALALGPGCRGESESSR